jgi:predicted nucleic acid-binding protein
MKVISNSSPLINFTALGKLTLLQALYGTITIPDAVYQEVLVSGRDQPGRAKLLSQLIVRATVNNRTAVARCTPWAW